MLVIVYLPVSDNMASMDHLIEEILAEIPDPIPRGQQFIDMDSQVPHPVKLPAGLKFLTTPKRV